MLLKKLSILILTLSSSIVLAESETLVFGDYVARIFSDGSGSVEKRFDPESIEGCNTVHCEFIRKDLDSFYALSDDEWSFHIRIDEMTDEQSITVRRYAYDFSEEYGGRIIGYKIKLFLDLTDKDYEFLCVLGHDFPGMTGMIRVDKTPAIETKENGCLQLTKDLDSQLRSGSKITIRGSNFPYKSPITRVIDLGGYSEMSDFLRSRRKQ